MRPALFPRRLSAEPLGEEAVAVSIAGVSFVFEGLDDGRARAMRKRYESWLEETISDASVTTRVLGVDEGDFRPFPGRGEEITTEVIPDVAGATLFGPLWMAWIDLGERIQGVLYLPPGRERFGEGAIENYLRVLAGHALLREGGVIVHSAAVVDRSEAHLFPAASGSGKSTLSRMSVAEGRHVLSDDMNALVRRGGRTCVEQVPFTGDSSRERVPGGPFPLSAVYRLRKGESTALAPLGRTEALGLLFAECPSLNSDPDRQDLLWDALESLADGVSFRTLTLSRDEPLWPRLVGADLVHAVA